MGVSGCSAPALLRSPVCAGCVFIRFVCFLLLVQVGGSRCSAPALLRSPVCAGCVFIRFVCFLR